MTDHLVSIAVGEHAEIQDVERFCCFCVLFLFESWGGRWGEGVVAQFWRKQEDIEPIVNGEFLPRVGIIGLGRIRHVLGCRPSCDGGLLPVQGME